jgi:iron(III) transport system substrate-binding protein
MAPLDEVCARAAEEESGVVTWWHTLDVEESLPTLSERFGEKYPGIEIEGLAGLDPDDQVQRIITEATAGSEITVDIAAAGNAAVAEPLIERGLIKDDVDWAALGVPEDVVLDSGLVRRARVVGGIGYNTDKFSADDLPDTWEELIDEKWRGRVVIDPRGRPFDQFALEWGEDEALDYVRRMKEVAQPLVVEGGTAGMLVVASGEADITTGARSSETRQQQAEGVPLDIKYLDLVPTYDSTDAVIEGGSNPLGATCFMAWMNSEGADLYYELEQELNDTVPPDAPPGAAVTEVTRGDDAALVRRVGQAMTEIWTQQ